MILHLKIKGHHDISKYLNNFILILLFNTSLATMGAFAHPLQNRTNYRMTPKGLQNGGPDLERGLPLFCLSKTQISWVSVSRPSPRLEFSKSQFWDHIQDWNFSSLNLKTRVLFLSLNFKTESKAWHGMVGYCNLEFILFKIKSETRFFWSWL